VPDPLPGGTVTFLFTDIEGSTRLAESLGTRWPAVLARHREIVRAALAAHGGIEVQTEGDGFFVVFASAPSAVGACAAAQRALAAESWTPDGTVRVRMGLHTGEGDRDADGQYVGPDVHRAARIASAAHGGQVLLSASTRALVADTLPDGVALRDLGWHRLKDLQRQELSQLVIEGLPSEFPSLRSTQEQPNNLPIQTTSFVGREDELRRLDDLLGDGRLLTLTGPGGTGKTRLALQVAALAAERFPDGVWFVALEPLREAALVLPTVARTMGVMPRADEPIADVLAVSIASRRILLVLDNFEHVVDAAGDVSGLLHTCPQLTLLVTSRAVLRVAGEREYHVPGLPTPPDPRRLSRVELEELPPTLRVPSAALLEAYEAVQLFAARARAVHPGFQVSDENAPAVAAITARLQGLPLAIELAAARVRLLTPQQILERLEQQLGLLTSGARDLPDRQRTLRAAIAWSCDLLDEGHARLLGRLSVFRGGWQLEAAEAVASHPQGLGLEVFDGLAELVDQSLVRRTGERAGEARYDMLESVAELAAERLAGVGEAALVRSAHAQVYLALAEEAAPHLQGLDQRRWLDRLEDDHDNLRAALGWALSAPEPATAVRLAFALWRFWQQRGYLQEARARLEDIVARDWELDAELRARLAEALGGVSYWQADLPAARRWYDEALLIRRAAPDTGPASRRELANALYNRGSISVAESIQSVEMVAPPDPQARSMLEEALAIYRALGDESGEANLLWGLGNYLMFRGQPNEAEAHFRQSLELHRAAGQRTMEAWSLHMLSTTLVIQARLAEAGVVSRHALRHFYEAGDVSGITLTLDVQSAVALGLGERLRGGRLWAAARQLQQVSGTGLAEWDARVFALMPYGVSNVFAPPELEAVAAEAAGLSLSEVVAYAMDEANPFAPR
jgi:predicted ATPase/class 3 adenylate cyclase